MNEVLDTILARHSVRHFSERTISKDDLSLIADAARHAPSGRNRQSWHFVVLQKPELITRLAGAIADALGIDRGAYGFYGANALILCGSDRADPLGIENCACAMENIFLAACSLGLGSVWINQLKDICDRQNVRPLLTQLGLPKNCVVYGTAALGYESGSGEKPPRREGTVSFVL